MKEYITPEQVSEILHLGRNTTYKLINRPDFPKIKLGRSFRIPKEDFERYMDHYLYKSIDFHI
jgi:excisionase family DNA binding protein